MAFGNLGPKWIFYFETSTSRKGEVVVQKYLTLAHSQRAEADQ